MHHRRFSVGLFVSWELSPYQVWHCATILAEIVETILVVGGHILQNLDASIPRSNLSKGIFQILFLSEETAYSASVVCL